MLFISQILVLRDDGILCALEGICAPGLAASAVAVQAHTRVTVPVARLAQEDRIGRGLVSSLPSGALLVSEPLQVSFSCFQSGGQRSSPTGPVLGKFLPAVYVHG